MYQLGGELSKKKPPESVMMLHLCIKKTLTYVIQNEMMSNSKLNQK